MGIYGNGGKYVYLPYDSTILQLSLTKLIHDNWKKCCMSDTGQGVLQTALQIFEILIGSTCFQFFGGLDRHFKTAAE